MATMAKTSDMAKKTGSSTTVDASRTCSNEESRENKCSNSVPHSESRVGTAQLICHEYG